jgi:hypothetical protein
VPVKVLSRIATPVVSTAALAPPRYIPEFVLVKVFVEKVLLTTAPSAITAVPPPLVSETGAMVLLAKVNDVVVAGPKKSEVLFEAVSRSLRCTVFPVLSSSWIRRSPVVP